MIVNFPSNLRRNTPQDKKPESHDLQAGNEAAVDVVVEIREGFKQVLAAVNDIGLQGRRRRSGFQVFPRLFTKAQAANYCGMGIERFAGNCSVKPIRVMSGARGLRWDIQDLDKWIDRLKENSSTDSENVDWLARLDDQNQDKRRQGLRQQG